MWSVIPPVQAVTEDSEATAHCELFLTAPNINILTYLLTYLLSVLQNLLYLFLNAAIHHTICNNSVIYVSCGDPLATQSSWTSSSVR